MRNKILYLFTFLLVLGSITSCSRDEKCPISSPKEYVGVYKGLVQVSVEGQELVNDMPQKIYIEEVGNRVVAVRMKNLDIASMVLDEVALKRVEILKQTDQVIYLTEGKDQINTPVGVAAIEVVEGTIYQDKLKLKLHVQVPATRASESAMHIEVVFNGDKMAVDQSSLAEFKGITLTDAEGEAVAINNVQINHEAKTVVLDLVNVSDEVLKTLVAQVEVSPKATVVPASGSTIDLSTSVKFTITSEDGITTNEYLVSVGNKTFAAAFDFETLDKKYSNITIENTSFAPATQGVFAWDSSDGGLSFLISFKMANKYGVTSSADAYTGKSAMHIETLDTKGKKLFGKLPSIPKVTSGSLFLGEFKLDPSEPLNSTKFGVLFDKKPIEIKGYYKYKSGLTYYYCPNPTPQNSHSAEKKPGQLDQGMLAAVLYEVNNAEESLTGLDIYTSDKIVAMKQLAVADQDVYQPFSLKLDYTKEYDATKTYKLAVIFSSSKDGDKFSGAPESILLVDDVTIVSE